MASSNDPRLEAYKKQIDWDKLREPGSPLGGVAASWPDIAKAPALAGGGWKVIADDVHLTDNVTEREWILRQQRQTLTVRVAVSSHGWEGARKHFLSSVSSTTMMNIPYAKSAAPIGALSVEMKGAQNGAVMAIFRNVCLQILTDETALDPRAVAQWLHSVAAGALVDDLAPRLPQLERLELSSNKLSVGAALTAKVWLSPSTPASARHTFSFKHDRAKLDLLEERGDTVRYRTLAAGTSRIVARVVDSSTLLTQEIGADVVAQ